MSHSNSNKRLRPKVVIVLCGLIGTIICIYLGIKNPKLAEELSTAAVFFATTAFLGKNMGN